MTKEKVLQRLNLEVKAFFDEANSTIKNSEPFTARIEIAIMYGTILGYVNGAKLTEVLDDEFISNMEDELSKVYESFCKRLMVNQFGVRYTNND